MFRGIKPLSMWTTSGVLIAMGVSVVILSIALIQLSLSGANCAQLFLVVSDYDVSSLIFLEMFY